jgi:hypothetical protein
VLLGVAALRLAGPPLQGGRALVQRSLVLAPLSPVLVVRLVGLRAGLLGALVGLLRALVRGFRALVHPVGESICHAPIIASRGRDQ